MGRADFIARREAQSRARAGSTPWRHLPNLITCLRVLLVVPAVSAVLAARYELALLLVLLAGVSDGIDGFLAKHFRWQSQFGALLDPVADKLLFVSLFVAFAVQQLLPRWLVAVVICRDVMIVAGAVAYRLLIGPFPGSASRLSKLNTAVLLTLGLAVLAAAGLGLDHRDAPGVLAGGLVMLGGLAFATTLLSGVHYVASWSARARRELAARAGAPRRRG